MHVNNHEKKTLITIVSDSLKWCDVENAPQSTAQDLYLVSSIKLNVFFSPIFFFSCGSFVLAIDISSIWKLRLGTKRLPTWLSKVNTRALHVLYNTQCIYWLFIRPSTERNMQLSTISKVKGAFLTSTAKSARALCESSQVEAPRLLTCLHASTRQ